MQLGAVLDIAIGLIFVYLLFALVLSGLQEVVAGILELRGKALQTGLRKMLSGEAPDNLPQGQLFREVFAHPLVRSGHAAAKLPSYVSRTGFSTAVLDTLMKGGNAPALVQIQSAVASLPDSPGSRALRALIAQSAGDVEKLRQSIERWFDDAMDRVSGVYKRWSQVIMFFLGAVVAILLNVDSMRIAHTLWTDTDARAAIVAMAESQSSVMTADEAKAQLHCLPLPIGWSVMDRSCACKQDTAGAKADTAKPACPPSNDQVFIWAFAGWLITAFAGMLGAPFWFDALQQVLRLRGTGPKPTQPKPTQ